MSFHELAEFFVRETDYQDRSGIYISYALHKMTIQENYQICQVIEEILAHQKEGSNLEDQDEGNTRKNIMNMGKKMNRKNLRRILVRIITTTGDWRIGRSGM